MNIGSILISRELSQELFPQVKKAFQALSGDLTEFSVSIAYLLLFFQQFTRLAIFFYSSGDTLCGIFGKLLCFCVLCT